MTGRIFTAGSLLGGVPTSLFSPASPQARSVYDLFMLTSGVMLAIMFFLCAWIVYILVHYRARPGETEDPVPVYGNKKLEIIWTLIPLAIVTVFTILMVPTIFKTHAEPDGRAPDITVIAHQWWWEVRYPDGVVTANEVHLPVGRPVLLALRTADVIHDFWVPRLGPKQDMLPGQTNYLWLQPDHPGIYDGTCAEYCGTDHGWMRIRVIAQTQADFDSWETAQLHPQMPDSSALAQEGGQIFTRSTCTNCHALVDAPKVAANLAHHVTIAPSLNDLGDRETLGAGTLDNSPENLAKWLKDPQACKPGSNMPDFHFSDEEVRALTAYLWRKSH